MENEKFMFDRNDNIIFYTFDSALRRKGFFGSKPGLP